MEDTRKYFQNYEGYFWQWETDHDAMESQVDIYNQLSIPHVSVIAYRSHALEILKVMSEESIPPFGAFLLVMYASGNFRFSNFDGLNYYLVKTEKKYGELVNRHHVLRFLESVSMLPQKLKTEENKVLLLQTVFHNCHQRITASKAQHILRGIEHPGILNDCAVLQPFNESAYMRDLKTLELLDTKFPDTASIIRAMEAIPEIPKLEDQIAEQEPVSDGKNFIDLLIEESKTFEVGNLIRHIWSGLKIPMQHFSPGDQPIGGISDMTNKGNINRMLLSEFAYDDDIFLQRVANNEALYIQREIPPEKNVFERVILIDVSLRNWGTPKVLALSTALAIARHPKAKDECHIFLVAKTAREMKHDTVEDVISALSLVGPVADCSEGLRDFFAKEPVSKKREVFLLTAEDSFAIPAVQKAINEYRDQFRFVVCFNVNGTIQFFKMKQGAKKLLQTIVLPLDELWKRPPVKKMVIPKEEDKTYPILFTAFPNELGGFCLDGEYFFLSRKKNLYRTYLGPKTRDGSYYYDSFRGWELLIKNISLKPKGVFALGKNGQNELLLCQYHPVDKLLSVLNLHSKKYRSLKCKGRESYSLLFKDGHFYFSNPENNGYHKVSIGEETLGLSSVEHWTSLHQVYLAQRNEVNRTMSYAKDILTNHHTVGITEEGKLHFSKHTLVCEHSNLVLVNRRPTAFSTVASRHGNAFCFNDGSIVFTDAEGMITLKSSNSVLPEIFIPSCVSNVIAASTSEDFCGSGYYLPQNHHLNIMQVESFYEKYIKEFIQQIIAHAGTA
ncbi:MAG: hypothetical protein QM687_00340 [Ferruginibacter sp.]